MKKILFLTIFILNSITASVLASLAMVDQNNQAVKRSLSSSREDGNSHQGDGKPFKDRKINEGLTPKIVVKNIGGKESKENARLSEDPLKPILLNVKDFTYPDGNEIRYLSEDDIKEAKKIISSIQHDINDLNESDVCKRRIRNKEGKVIEVINLDINHILNVQMEFVKHKNIGEDKKDKYLLDIKGCHIAGSCKLLAEKKIVNIKQETNLENGCVKYDLVNNFTGQEIVKTEFPKSWTIIKIIESIWNVFDNGKDVGFQSDNPNSPTRSKGGKILLVDEVNIMIIINKPNDSTKNIITAYPVFAEN